MKERERKKYGYPARNRLLSPLTVKGSGNLPGGMI